MTGTKYKLFLLFGLLFLFSETIKCTGLPDEEALAKMFRDRYQLEKLFVTIDSQENVLVTGFFSDTLQIENHRLQSQGILDIFIAKYDKDLQLVWLKHAGGAQIDFSKFINTDKYDNIYIQGLYKGKAFFEGYNLDSKGTYDYFTAKYDYNGKLLWVKTRKGSAIINKPKNNYNLWFSRK